MSLPDPHTPDLPLAARSEAAPAPLGPRVLCPYCGLVQPVTARCAGCKGLLDSESRQATQNAMGPWQVRNTASPFHPGCSYPTLREMVRRGKITRETIIRGPTTGQFWSMAANTPGVAVLLGECHACHQHAREDEYLCRHCGVVLSPRTDRQHLGLGPVRPVGVPVNQPPVASAPPQSAFVSAPTDTSRNIHPDPMTTPALGLNEAVSGHGVSVLARRQREHRRRNVLLLSAAGVLCAAALLAVVAVTITRGASARPGPAVANNHTAPSGSTPPAADPRIRFAAPLTEARRLASIGDIPSLESALAALQRVRTEHGPLPAGAPDGASKFLDDLDRIIEGVRARLDDARLTEALSASERPVAPPTR